MFTNILGVTLKGKKLDTFKEKCDKAEKTFDNGGIYICPVCDGTSSWCDDDYQSVECEELQRDMLGDKYYPTKEELNQ